MLPPPALLLNRVPARLLLPPCSSSLCNRKWATHIKLYWPTWDRLGQPGTEHRRRPRRPRAGAFSTLLLALLPSSLNNRKWAAHLKLNRPPWDCLGHPLTAHRAFCFCELGLRSAPADPWRDCNDAAGPPLSPAARLSKLPPMPGKMPPGGKGSATPPGKASTLVASVTSLDLSLPSCTPTDLARRRVVRGCREIIGTGAEVSAGFGAGFAAGVSGALLDFSTLMISVASLDFSLSSCTPTDLARRRVFMPVGIETTTDAGKDATGREGLRNTTREGFNIGGISNVT